MLDRISKNYRPPLWCIYDNDFERIEDGFLPHWPILYPGGYEFDYDLRPYYDWMLKQQNGVCAICRKYRVRVTWNRMHVDHNHSTGEIRGVLCGWCNVMLGLSGNDDYYLYDKRTREPTSNLHLAIKYLETDRTGYPVYTKEFKNTSFCEKWREKVKNTCEICGESGARRLAVDHDHYTGLVRGLLCTRCNLMLGNADDSIAVLKKAIHYLKFAPYW